MKAIVLTLPALLFTPFVAGAGSPKAEATFVHRLRSWCAYWKRLGALLEN